jgi:hypothetical protein
MIGLFGAYERYNFGDRLYLELALKGMRANNIPSVLIGPFELDNPGLPTPVHGYANATTGSMCGAWVLGGELGHVSLATAHWMTFGSGLHDEHVEHLKGEARREVQEAAGIGLRDPAYIPPASLLREVKGPVAFTSVGVRKASEGTDSSLASLWASFSQASLVWVRDATSSEILTSRGIAHELQPDMCHCISKYHVVTSESETWVLVQMSAAFIEREGVKTVSEKLAQVSIEMGLPLRLISASERPGHDRRDLLEAIRLEVIRLSGQCLIVFAEDDVKGTIAHIAGAGLIISTSLHFRIVAASYDVPRVSLLNPKVSNYLSNWDPEYPQGVTISELIEACRSAATMSSSSGVRTRSRSVRDRADANMRQVLAAFEERCKHGQG